VSDRSGSTDDENRMVRGGSAMDNLIGALRAQRDSMDGLHDRPPRLQYSQEIARDESVSFVRFESHELGWLRREGGRTLLALTGPAGAALRRIDITAWDKEGRGAGFDTKILSAYYAALRERYPQFGGELEGFRQNLESSREVEAYRTEMEAGAHGDGRYYDLVYHSAAGRFRSQAWNRQPPAGAYGEKDVVVHRSMSLSGQEKPVGRQAMVERLTLSYVGQRLGPIEERVERAIRGFAVAFGKSEAVVKGFVSAMERGNAQGRVEDLVYDMKSERVERREWNRVPGKEAYGEGKVLLARFGPGVDRNEGLQAGAGRQELEERFADVVRGRSLGVERGKERQR